MNSWILLVLLSMVWAVGDVLYKQATNVSGEINLNTVITFFYDGAVDLVLLNLTTESRFLLLFGGAMGLAFSANLLFSIPLSRLPVSVAKPALNSLTIAFVAILSVLVFNEPMTSKKVVGLVLVGGGVWLLSI